MNDHVLDDSFDRITVAYLRSPGCDAAVGLAVRVAARTGAPLRLLTVVVGQSARVRAARLAEERLRWITDDHIADLSAAARARGGAPVRRHVQTEIVRGANAAKAVLSADWTPGELLVIAAGPVGPFRKVLRGDMSARILRAVPCPAIVLPRTTLPKRIFAGKVRLSLVRETTKITADLFGSGKELRHTDVVKYVPETTTHATAPLPGAVQSSGHSERDTRARVARLILEHGPITASGLGQRIGLTPAAIRRHLDALLSEGMIEVRRARPQAQRGRGRPAKLFAITDAGRSAFVHAYDDLATSALRFLAEVAGGDAVVEFARRQIADLERRYRPVVRAAPQHQRVRVLAEALSGDGYAASASESPHSSGPLAGQQLCQHHCPVAHVAAEFPQLCEAETEAFGRLLGTPVQRLATIAHGDGICTTHVTAQALCEAGTAADAVTATADKKPNNEESGGTSQ